MENSHPQWAGPSCGRHASYIFYKGFKYIKNNRRKEFFLGDFFFVRCSDHEPICIAELQLLWETKHSEGCKLCSVRLYFLPESTPQGRNQNHGLDEVLAVRGKVVLKVEDLVDWIVTDVTWTYGFNALCESDVLSKPIHINGHQESTVSSCAKERSEDKSESVLKPDAIRDEVVVLSYPKYCRYRSAVKRMENVDFKSIPRRLIEALGLFLVPRKGTKIVFCRDDFDHPSLADNEKLCEHLAPKLKGRPRKKKSSVSEGPGEDPKEKEEPLQNLVIAKSKPIVDKKIMLTRAKTEKLKVLRRTGRKKGLSKAAKEEDAFLSKLYKFMEQRETPIERVPSLGFRQLNLHEFYKITQKYGGYDKITSQRLWKKVFSEMGGDPGCTSAATCTRKHYEKLMLPYEEHLKSRGKKEKFLPEKRRGRKPKLKISQMVEKKEKKVQPRKKAKKVREHLQEWNELKERKFLDTKRVSVKLENLKVECPEIMTVQSSSLPGNNSMAVNLSTKNDTPAPLIKSEKPASHGKSDPYAFQLEPGEDKSYTLNHRQFYKKPNRASALPMSSSDLNSVHLQKYSGHKRRVSAVNGILREHVSAADSINRPSVIQHTDQSQINAVPYFSQSLMAQQEMLLRQMHLSKGKRKSKDERERGKDLPPTSQANFQRFVFPPVVPLMRPLYPLVPPAFMVGGKMPPFSSFPPRLPSTSSGSSNESEEQRDLQNLMERKTYTEKDPIDKPLQVPVIQPVPPTALIQPVQDEPCDLSLPKKRKRPNEESKDQPNNIPKSRPETKVFVKRSTKVKDLVQNAKAIKEAQQRAEMEHKRLVVAWQSASEASKRSRDTSSPSQTPVKMTPNPRGSITQGVIDAPSASKNSISFPSAIKKHSKIKEATPSTSGVDTRHLPFAMFPPGIPSFMGLGARGLVPFPFIPRYVPPGFPPMVPPGGVLPRSPFLPPHSPLLASVPTSLSGSSDGTLPRGVMVPTPMGLTSPIFGATIPPLRSAEGKPSSAFKT